MLDDFLDSGLDEKKREWVRRQHLPDLLNSLALGFISSAKNKRQTPESLRLQLDRQPATLPLAEMGLAIYSDYQRALTYRGAVDFDDLIRLAVDLLEADEEYLERLRYRYPYILEDEAQDSSLLQEQILRTLAGEDGNWVRVGDPNQAIFETFTTANPKYLREFIENESEFQQQLPVSGRSQPSIIKLANYPIEWVMNEHPVEDLRDALAPPKIRPTEKDDPQPNPPDDSEAIHIVGEKFTPEEELNAVIDSLARWLPENTDKTVAVLVPRNTRGVDVINALKKKGLETLEFLSSTHTTRATAGSIANLISFLAEPQSARKLSKAYQVWRRDWRDEESIREVLNEEEMAESGEALLSMTRHVAELLRKIPKVEDYLSPETESLGWLASLSEPAAGMPSEAEDVIQELSEFREKANRWLKAVTLPIDQLILTLAQDVFTSFADLALAHKLALVMRKAAADHKNWRLPELIVELAVIAKNERRFIGFSADDSGFNPERHKGTVVVTTMHKAKGLEWDRVHLMSVNNYDFPSLQPYDSYISEKWFIRDGLNLEAEALAQFEGALSKDEYDWYAEGQASLAARADYVRERLRLFFVGITRAKRELIVTWNTGRQGDAQPSLALQALMGWWVGQ